MDGENRGDHQGLKKKGKTSLKKTEGERNSKGGQVLFSISVITIRKAIRREKKMQRKDQDVRINLVKKGAVASPKASPIPESKKKRVEFQAGKKKELSDQTAVDSLSH